MGRYKYYLSYQHDHEECVEGTSDTQYHEFRHKDGSKLSDKEYSELGNVFNEKTKDEYYEFINEKKYDYVDIQNIKDGEKLVIRVDKKSKVSNQTIQAPYYDFTEHHREIIKARKGYLKRKKKRSINVFNND